MASPTELLTEAGPLVTRATVLIRLAGAELGPPFTEPLERIAADLENSRRRLRNATTTATTEVQR